MARWNGGIAVLLLLKVPFCPGRTAVVVLGYDPRGHNWERVVWGEPRAGLLGRVPQGVLVAESMCAELLVLGDGILDNSRNPHGADGSDEAETFCFDPLVLLERRLPELRAFGGALAALSEVSLRDRLLPRCVRQSGARNTREEVAYALDLCASHGYDRLVLVTSSTHVPRCARDACALLEERGAARPMVLTCASGTSFSEGEGADSVAIVEPPHRNAAVGDKTAMAATMSNDGELLGLHRLVQRALLLDSRRRGALCVRIAEVIELLEREVDDS